MKFEFHVLFKSTSHTQPLDAQAAEIRDAVLETASDFPQVSEVYVSADPNRSGIAVGLRLSVALPEYADETAKDFLDDVVAALNQPGVTTPVAEFRTARQTLVAV